MSGEYYASEEPVNKFYKHYSCSPHSAKNQSNQDSLDFDKHLQIAESRCNVLHEQLDNFKQIYGTNRNNPKTRKLSTLPPEKKSFSDGRASALSLSEELGPYRTPSRQISTSISTDTTGAAVRTINHILNGITDSVNRLSELHVKASESPRAPSPRKSHLFAMQDEIGKDVVTRSSTAINVDVSLNNKKRLRESESRAFPKKAVTASSTTIKRPLKTDKKTYRTVAGRRYNKSNCLVELYHNEAVTRSHLSDSDDCQQNKKHKRPQSPVPKDDIPPLEIFPRRKDNFQELIRLSARPSSAINGRKTVHNNFYESAEGHRTEIMGPCYSKNYELPTVSSKMKQVAKSYMSGLNFKVIPFCPAMSTTPSHNIGINIQQVMNVIKNRQPFQGISLTLAHNIGLAAEKLNNKPFSSLVSRINSKIVSATSKCPLSKSVLNYNELQEMAKAIPEDVIEECDEDLENAETPEIKTVYITGPSGDVAIKTRNVPTWIADPSKSEQCTCIPQPNIDLEKITNKYYKNTCKTLTTRSVNSQIVTHKRRMLKTKSADANNRIIRAQTRTSMYAENPNKPQQVMHQPMSAPAQEIPESKASEAEDFGTVGLQGREKNLKLVLTNLHTEFEDINKRYDFLSKRALNDPENQATLKELEDLETELNKKEEEITMVMTLYKEVLALKQQVKLLRDKKSQSNIVCKDQPEKAKFNKEYNNPEAAFHLTKLLTQIQHYQMRYKTTLECD